MSETTTSRIVAFLAESEEQAKAVAAALEKEGIPSTLGPAAGYHRIGDGRVEVIVGAESAPRARVLAIAAARGGDGT